MTSKTNYGWQAKNMKGFNYFMSKLFDINYRISIHDGNANRRLASMTPQILFQLVPYRKIVPNQYRKEFDQLSDLIRVTLQESEGRLPVRIGCIQSRTASKYIKILIDIEACLEN